MGSSGEIQIGELARRSGCNIETIRYYERIGLLPSPARSTGRYRLYDSAAIRRLVFVRRARELGFTLDEVRALLALSTHDGHAACAEVRHLAADHLTEVRAKIADLKAIAKVLAEAVRQCNAGELPGCPLIDALSVAPPPLHLVGGRRGSNRNHDGPAPDRRTGCAPGRRARPHHRG